MDKEKKFVANPWLRNPDDRWPMTTLSKRAENAALRLVSEVFRTTKASGLPADSSVYTGTSGLAYILWSFGVHSFPQRRVEFHRQATDILDKIRMPKKWKPTFLTGSMGIMALRITLRGYMKSEEFADLEENIKKLPSDTPDELMYGRAGLLWAILFIVSQLPADEALAKRFRLQQLAQPLCDGIISTGFLGNNSDVPLYYEWREKAYLGAAHGFVGILATLKQASQIFPDMIKPEQMILIESTYKWILEQRYPSGNIPSSYPAAGDKLIHWCHGASGLLPLALMMGDKQTAGLSADVIWERGLLVKGNSLCHGVAGNGLSLLMNDMTHGMSPIRAGCFAQFILERESSTIGHVPDRPNSLFEGKLGSAFFLAQIAGCVKDSSYALHFPGFTLPPTSNDPTSFAKISKPGTSSKQ